MNQVINQKGCLMYISFPALNPHYAVE